MRWTRIQIETVEGPREAVAPEIISASRATDIPAFHAEWFLNRLRAGYVRWVNPFNGAPQYVSFARARAIILWTKNPAPMLPHLDALDALGIPYYVQFTVNDYAPEGLEPGVPPLAERVTTFRTLAARLGRERVVWRFDPLILAGGLEPEALLDRVRAVGDLLHPHTRKLIFSFADIDGYAKVARNLRAAGIPRRNFTPDEMQATGRAIADHCRAWGLQAGTCGEAVDLSAHGIEHNRCVDDELLLRITRNDPALVELFGYRLSDTPDLFGDTPTPRRRTLKDPGQRTACGCVFSKDIGQYNTCGHLCVYCYANTSPAAVARNAARCGAEGEAIIAGR